MKPVCVTSDNANMGTINKTDMFMSSTECVRHIMKWYRKLFFHCIDMCLLNAYSAFKAVTSSHINLADFQLQLLNQILLNYKNGMNVTQNKCRKKQDNI